MPIKFLMDSNNQEKISKTGYDAGDGPSRPVYQIGMRFGKPDLIAVKLFVFIMPWFECDFLSPVCGNMAIGRRRLK